jgi:hypothetical protein
MHGKGDMMSTRTDIDTELDLAKNMFGSLKEDIRDRIYRLYENPTVETWDDTHGIIVGGDGWMTLWQVILKVDPTFPSLGRATDRKGKVVDEWKRIPDRELIRRALYFATH